MKECNKYYVQSDECEGGCRFDQKWEDRSGLRWWWWGVLILVQ